MGVSTTLEFCLHVGFGSTLAVKKKLVFIYFFRVVVNVLYVFDFLYVSSEWLTDIFRKGPQGSELLFSNWSLDSAMQHTTPR